jgi:hypothetical protein
VIGSVDRAHPVDEHVDRSAGRGQLLQLARHQHERLGPDDQPVALVDLGRDDEVDRAVLVLKQEEDDPAGRSGPLARHHQPPESYAPAVFELLEIPAGDGVRSHPLAQQGQWMRSRRQTGGAVVGEHRLPLGEVAQRGRRRQVERERQLGAPGNPAARRHHAQLPERHPPCEARPQRPG